jgi:hypothetical protein
VGIKQMLNLVEEAKTKGTAGAKALDALGLSAKALEGMTTDQKFEAIAAAIAAIPDPADRANAAMSVFGSKSGLELLPMIEDMEKLKQDFEALNTMMSNEAVEAADKFGDQMLNLTTVLTNLIANSGMIKWLADIVEGMNSVISIGDKLGEKTGIGAPGSAGYRGGVSGFVSNLADAGHEGSGWNPLNWAGKGLHALGVGEQEGDISLKATDTAADKKKLADKKKKFEETGKTTPEQIADKAAADAKAKADKREKELEEQSRKAIEGLEEQVKLQQMLNDKKEREAAIEKALYDAQQAFSEKDKENGRKLNDKEIKKISDAAGQLYDLQKQGEIKKQDEDKEQEIKLQELLNAKKERQAAIEKELYERRKTLGRELTQDEVTKVTADTGKLFDLQKDKESKKQIEDMQEKLKLQTLVNEGKKREAAIEEALDAAKKTVNRDLTDSEQKNISGIAGKLFDAQHQKIDTAGSFYANSLAMQSSGGASERTAKATETIVKNTKETNQILKDRELVFQ